MNNPNARRFAFSGDYIGKFSERRPRLLISDEVIETIRVLVPAHRLGSTVGAFERLKAGDFMFVPNAGWLFCVNIPEPCGVCNGHGCAECDPNC